MNSRAFHRAPGRRPAALHNRSGQALIFVMLSLTVLFGLTALCVDFGVIYKDQEMLNASTQAATLAGGEAMALPGATASSITTTVTDYSSASGGQNAQAYLSGAALVSGYPKLACLTTLQTLYNLSCYGPSNSNAVVVKQQVSVPLFFLRLFGANSITLTSTASASMRGASAAPYNVVIIVDTTQSMTSKDSDSNCNNTRISCALAGVGVLLQHLSPCSATLSSCGTVTSGNVSNSVDRVSLLTFPPVTTATVADDYNCGSTSPTVAPYTNPFPSTSTYQIVNFSSDYRTSDTASSLSSTSNLAKAVNGTSGTPCLKVVGGDGTYYAQVIYAAQAYLAAEKLLFPTSQNVMILLSDGDAGASSSKMPGASTTGTTYMAVKQQCAQAVTAAQAAAAAGTRVYAVAYGAEASGCSTDTNPTITPCQTMQSIASSSAYFFSDYTATGSDSSCISASQPVTNLSQIFQTIANDMTVSKLIPNGTT